MVFKLTNFTAHLLIASLTLLAFFSTLAAQTRTGAVQAAYVEALNPAKRIGGALH